MTRFRAYQMNTAGSSFSYWDGSTFTLLEARFNNSNANSIQQELKACGRQKVDTLHITSCNPGELKQLLYTLTPTKIDLPKYYPKTDSSKQALQSIGSYLQQTNSILAPPSATVVDGPFVSALPFAISWDTTNVIYNYPYEDSYNSNNNSTIKLFRSGSFSVLSLGDVETENIANWLTNDLIIQREVDILILAHHGADNGFTTSELIAKINPKIAICSSNYDNQHEHPKSEIRSILQCANVPLMTTKTGDVIVAATNALTRQFTGFNLGANSTALLSSFSFSPKKMRSPLENFRSNSSTSQLLFGGVGSNSLLRGI
jgi:competence protein ComEC